MNLTIEQIEAIKEGEPVRVANSEVGMDCVIVRADIYENVQSLLNDGGDPREMYPAVLKALDACDESPDQYLEYLDE